jgi:hypothetical protein
MASIGPTVQRMIVNILQSEPAMLSFFPGGILTRPPQKGNGWTATPDAFYGTENPLESAKLKPLIVVLDGGENPSPDAGARNGYVEFPLVRGYARDDLDGEKALKLLGDRLRARFTREWYQRDDGRTIEFLLLERQPVQEADEFGFAERIFTIWRIQATYVYGTGE